MFLAVWILYIGDRLLDTRRLGSASISPAEGGLEERHFFHARHRVAFLTAAALAAFVLSGLLVLLPAAALRLYALLGSLLAVYFLVIHVLDGERRLPKELAVGVFFSAAVFIPTVARRPELRLQLLPLALLFAVLCSVNCLRILGWERPGAAHRPRTLPGTRLNEGDARQALHLVTRSALHALFPLHVCLALLTGVLAVAERSLLAVAVALSAVLLWTLHLARERVSRVHLRAAADLALVTPLPVAVFAALWRR